MPSPSRPAQRSPSAPPFATQPSPSRMSSVSAAPSPRISSGCARIASAARAPPASASSREKAWAMRSSVEREGHDAAAVDRGRHRPRTRPRRRPRPRRASPAGTGASRADSRRVGQPRSRQRSSIAACFPEQLCSSRVGSGPHSRSSSVAPGLREQAPHGLELVGAMEVRRARDRDLGVVEVRPRAHERQRLDRLRGAPEEGDERAGRRTTRRSRSVRRRRRHGRDARASTTPPRVTSTTIGSTAAERYRRLRMVGISRMFRNYRPITPTTSSTTSSSWRIRGSCEPSVTRCELGS